MHKKNDAFHQAAPYAYEILMERRLPPRPDDVCTACALSKPSPTVLGTPTARYRCEDCIPEPDLCIDCVRAVHRFSPFHRLLRWDAVERTWVRTAMGGLDNFLIHLGHRGLPCPHPTSEPVKIVVVHEGGIVQDVKVQYCGCPSTSETWKRRRPFQLLAYGLFPGSWSQPRSAYTLTLAKMLELLLLQAQPSIHDLSNFLRRLTDNVNWKMVKVSGCLASVPICIDPCSGSGTITLADDARVLFLESLHALWSQAGSPASSPVSGSLLPGLSAPGDQHATGLAESASRVSVSLVGSY